MIGLYVLQASAPSGSIKGDMRRSVKGWGVVLRLTSAMLSAARPAPIVSISWAGWLAGWLAG
jgi:hypothetical protein